VGHRGGHHILLDRGPARQVGVAEGVRRSAAALDRLQQLAAVDDVHRGDRLLRITGRRGRRLDLVGGQRVGAPQWVDERPDRERTVVVQVALEPVAEQSTQRLPATHALQHRQRELHPTGGDVDRHCTGVRDVGVAQHGRRRGVVDRGCVHQAEVGGVLHQRRGGVLVDVGGEIGGQRHLGERLALRHQVLDPAVRAEVEAARSPAPGRSARRADVGGGDHAAVGRPRPDLVERPAQQPGAPRVEPVARGVDVLGQQPLQPRGGQGRQQVEGLEVLRQHAALEAADVPRDVVADPELGVAGHPGFGGEQLGVAALGVGGPVGVDVHERRLAAQRGRVVERPGRDEQADRGLPEAELQRVPEQQVEQRLGPLAAVEPLLGLDRADAVGRGVGQPPHVVAPTGVRTDGRSLRQRYVVHERPIERPLPGVVDLREEVGHVLALVAEPAEQVDRLLRREPRDQLLDKLEAEERELVRLVLEAVGGEREVLHGRGVQADDVEQLLVWVGAAAPDPADLRDQRCPVGLDLTDQSGDGGREPQRVGDLLAEPAQPAEGDGGLDAVGLVGDPQRRQRPAAAHLAGEELPGRGNVGVGEDRLEEGVHQVADRRRPQRDLHRPRLHAVRATGAGDPGGERVADRQRVGQPLPVATPGGVGLADVARLLLEERTEARVGVVAPGVAGVLLLGVVGGSALLQQLQAAARVQVVLKQPSEPVGSCLRRVREAYAEHDQPSEAAGGLGRGEVLPEGHPHLERALEVEHPGQRVGDLQRVGAVGVVAHRLELVGRGGVGVRPRLQPARDRLADPEDGGLRVCAVPAEEDEAVGQHVDARCARPRRRTGAELGRVGQLQDAHPRGGLVRAQPGGRRVLEVGGPVGDDLVGGCRAERRLQVVVGLLGGGRLALTRPDRRPVGTDLRRLGADRHHDEVERRVCGLGLVAGVLGHECAHDPARAAGPSGRDELAPSGALEPLVASCAPDRGPERRAVLHLGGRQRLLEPVDEAGVGVDADPELRHAGRRRLEAGLEAEREEQDRRAVVEPADLGQRVGEGPDPPKDRRLLSHAGRQPAPGAGLRRDGLLVLRLQRRECGIVVRCRTT
jgi:hypothetical protein